MKKISIFIMLAVLVTISGVYATWNYAQENAPQNTAEAEILLAEKVVDTPKGTITTDLSGLNITIDDTNGDYVAELVMTGEVVITFEAADGVDADVAANGIPLQYALTVTTPWEYEGTQIFTVNTAATVLNNGNATFSVTIPASELASKITLGNISLPTVEEYDAFDLALDEGQIEIVVSEATN